MTMLWSRLFLYALSGWLVARGMPADMADLLKDPLVIADLNVAIGAVVFAATKFWHSLAKKHGWAT